MADKFDVYYRVHAQTFGWLGWAKNGETAGTSGFAKRLEAIQIYVVPKGMTPSSGTSAVSYVQYGKAASKSDQPGLINYATHVQTYGNQQFVSDGSFSGTYGEAKRLEAIRIQVNNEALGVDGGVTYHTHVQKLGWQPWVSDGVVTGTTGQAKRLEAIQIRLGRNINGGVRYKTHVQTFGWQNWVSNGTTSGTSGLGKRLEAIQIELTGQAAQQYDIYYRVHVQSYGWLDWAKNGQMSGTSGLAKRLEGIQIVVVKKGASFNTRMGNINSAYALGYYAKAGTSPVVNAKNTRQSMSMNEENCAGRGSPIWNALVVTETPSRPTFHEPVITIVSPVIVQITSVSIKVPIIEIRPCCAGASATAAAAAIGALPRPASLEKIPLF